MPHAKSPPMSRDAPTAGGPAEPAQPAGAPRAEATDAGELCERVVLDVEPDVMPSAAPPVRIFLGTEPAQARAERIFVYSVERLRDPARVYEIHLMKDLPGFDRRAWRTGFTNYRFAIPTLAGRRGRAIYNDVDQIYLRDPAQLFDLDLDGHGYLAISPKDTSVMLIDCGIMARWWNLEAARRRDKKPLTDEPAAVAGLWGALDPGWNARDTEYDPARTGVLHYTTLHLQPWQPTPDQYAYQFNPLGEVWYGLEREADAAGAQVFGPHRPSRAFRDAGAAVPQAAAPPVGDDGARFLAEAAGSAPRLHVGFRHRPPEGWAGPGLDLGATPAACPETEAPVDAVAATGLVERLPCADVPWVLDRLFELARGAVHLRVDLDALAAGAGPAAATWWRDRTVEAAGRAALARDRGPAWRLETEAGGGRRVFEARPPRTPRVWVLEGAHGGDNAQMEVLAEALGWPWERKALSFKATHRLPAALLGESVAGLDAAGRAGLAPPWPDVVIACGKRSAPVARWIKRRSQGRTATVHMGRPRAPLDAFDVVLTTAQYRLPMRSNVLYLTRALNRVSTATLSRARAGWADELAALPTPRIGVVLGGDRWPYRFSTGFAERLARELDALARRRRGSLLVVDSPRTPEGFVDAVSRRLAMPHRAIPHRLERQPLGYPAVLALADTLVVTEDSASLLAEATATGTPVHTVEPARLDEGRWNPFARLAALVAPVRRRTGERGTPRQQGPVGRAVTRLAARGWFTPPRDMRAYVAHLERHGLSRPLHGEGAAVRLTPPDDLERAVEAVRKALVRGVERTPSG